MAWAYENMKIFGFQNFRVIFYEVWETIPARAMNELVFQLKR